MAGSGDLGCGLTEVQGDNTGGSEWGLEGSCPGEEQLLRDFHCQDHCSGR